MSQIKRGNPVQAPQAGGSFDVRFMQKGKHSVILYLPEAYHAAIGLVIAYWGSFESIFNACLAGLIEGEKADGRARETSDWIKQRFKTRRRLFKEICSEWLQTWRPEEAALLGALVDRAGDLSWKRNMIAHGIYAYSVPPASSVAQNCRAVNPATGEEFPFDGDVLKKLYHDISHLTADLVSTFREFGEFGGAFLTVPDAEILRVYRETHHPWHPNPRKRSPKQSPASGAGADEVL